MDWFAIRELNNSSINWFGIDGPRLVDDPEDPMPARVFGDLSAEDFLHEHLMHLYDPMAAGFGVMADSATESTFQSAPWSVADPSYSFYDDVLDNVFFAHGPALAADELSTVPQLVDVAVCTRSVQVSRSNIESASAVMFGTVSKVIQYHVC